MNDQKTCLRPRKYWIFAVLTLIVAGGWYVGTEKVAGHVKTTNLYRMVGTVMIGGNALIRVFELSKNTCAARKSMLESIRVATQKGRAGRLSPNLQRW